MKALVTAFFLFVLFGILNPFQCRASRVLGAELSYKWLSGNTFQVNLSVYRDCSSEIPLPARQKVFYSSFSCRPTQDSINMQMVGGPVDVTPLCNREPSNCAGGTNPGIQRYRYQGIVTLPQKCTDWIFYFRQCNRTANIGTVVNPQNNCLYIEASLNNLLAPGNSSPRIGNDPISFLCVGQAVNYNPGISDPDGDRLKFKLVVPRTNSRIPNIADVNVVTYKPGFSATYPMPCQDGFGFDTTSGQFSFIPSQEISGVTAVRITESRNGKVIGSTMFDFPLFARTCQNTVPTLSGFDNGDSFEKLVCVGDTLRTIFYAEDQNQGDSLRFSWNSNLPDSLFTSDSSAGMAKAFLDWAPTAADTGIRSFSITVSDDACPAKASTSKTYVLKIRLKPLIEVSGDTMIPCGATIPISARVVKGVAPFQYYWPGLNAQTNTIVVGHGTYPVKVTDATGCGMDDSVRVLGSSVSGYIKIDTSCVVEGVQLTAMPYAADSNLTFTYQWSFPPENQVFTGKVLRRKFETEGWRQISLKISGSDNCSVVISGTTFVCPRPPVYALFAPNVCQGVPFRIGCGIPGRGGLCGMNRLCIILEESNWINFPSTGQLILPPDSLRPDSNTFKVITYSFNNCTNSNRFKFRVKPSPKILVNLTGALVYNCNRPDTTILIKIWKDSRFVYDSLWARITFLNTVILLPKTTQDTITYSLRLSKPCFVSIIGSMANNCNAFYSFSYQPTANAVLNLSPHCHPTDSVHFYSNLANTRFNSFAFNLGNGVTTTDSVKNVFYPPGQVFNGFFTVEDTLGCRDTSYFTVDTRLPDTTVLVSKDTSCLNASVRFRIKDTSLIHQWKFSYLSEFRILNAFKMEDSLSMPYPGTASIEVDISYKQGCIRTWQLAPVYVRQPIVPAIQVSNVCAYDTSYLKGTIAFSEFPVTDWHWRYEYPTGKDPGFSEDFIQNPSRKFGYNGRFRAILTAIDVKGCMGRDTLDSTMVLVSKPEFDVNGNCQNDSLVFFFGKVPDAYENIEQFTYIYNDGKSESTGNGQGLHQFREPGIFDVRLIAYTSEGCNNSDTNTLEIKPRPRADFALPPGEICQGMVFRVDGSGSRPATPDQQITSYVWATNEENPISTDASTDVRVIEAGNAYVALQVRSSNGCQDYLKIPFASRPRPVPDFFVSEEDITKGDQIYFQDQSIGATFWKWDFGDGTPESPSTSNEASPVHKYTYGSVFQVSLLVSNSFGCADSISKKVNLKSFIALPNAFSPNGDSRNDQFGLVHRFVRKLEEFKVYNRLGQLVFDAGTNLDSRWDGSLEGKVQPNGNYLYYAKAESVFGEVLELKGSLTLIR